MFDIGVNLTNAAFNPDRDEVVRRAVEAGVTGMAITGTNLDTSSAGIRLATQYSQLPGVTVCATVGVHPHDARSVDDDWLDGLEHLAQHAPVAAIGETGLDFNRNYSPRPAQIETFHAQLDLASRLGLPVFVHDRESSGEVGRVLGEYRSRLSRVVVHCFTGSREDLESYLDAGFHIGVTGWVCDERRGGELASLLPHIPSERLMVETDAPFLLPRTITPKPPTRRNEPAYLAWVVDRIASLRGEDAATVARQTHTNAEQFFQRPAPSSQSRT